MKEYAVIRAIDVQLRNKTDAEIDRLYSGIAEDGKVDGHAVDTYYAPAERILLTEDGVLHIVCDNGATDIETRIYPGTLESLGFSRAEDRQKSE